MWSDYMILDKVSIKNYRQYRDVEIDFAKKSNQNFTIIQGNNGTGKTTLLNALTWCLYGTEIHSYGQYTAMSQCNNKSANLAEDGDEIEVSVKIDFLDEDEKLVSFERKKVFYKNNGELRESPAGKSFTVTKQVGNDFNIYPDDQYTVQRMIPKKVEEYFFFDGARLGEYFQHNSKQNIKDSVFQLSQLNLVESVSKNLGKVIEQYTHNQKKIAPAIGSINEKINQAKETIENYENKIEESNRIIDDAELEIKDIEQKLLNMDSGAVKKAVKRDIELKENIKKLEKKLNGSDGYGGLVAKRRKLILENYPYLLSFNSFKKFLELGEDSRKKGYIPSKYKRSFLQDMLDEGICICGADLSEDTKHRKAIELLLKETDPLTDESEKVTSELTHVQEVILRRVSKFKEKDIEINSQIYETSEELKEAQAERLRIKGILENTSIEDIKVLDSIKNDLEAEIRKQNRNIGTYKAEIRMAQDKKVDYEQLRRKQDSDSEKSRVLSEKIEFCENADEASKFVYKTLTKNMQNEIQNLTKDKFIKIQWKEDEFVDIKLDSNYELSIINKTGDIEKPGDLSDGEKLCLGLCFMSALHRISGFDLPIVMDTPLGNLDVDMRQNIAKFLPQFVEGKQIILLVTGTEYTSDFRDILYDNIGKEYTINWDNSENGKESKVILNG